MHKYLRILILVLLAAVFITISAVPALSAERENADFAFMLTVDGKTVKEVNCGDIITVSLKLSKAGQADKYTMYAMQDELQYDSRILEVVEGSEMVYSGIMTTDIEKAGGYRELYWNFLSQSGGSTWNWETVIGTIQFRVIGTSGITSIKNNDYLVSLQDGSGSYLCTCEDVTVIISTDCTVRFHSNGGTSVKNQIVQYGEKVTRPEDSTREGYQFAGWYTDIDLSTAWDFETDLVKENMSLYAKWIPETQSDLEPNESNGPCIWWIAFIIVLSTLLFLWIRKYLMKRR